MQIAAQRAAVSNYQRREEAAYFFPPIGKMHDVDVGEKDQGNGQEQQETDDSDGQVHDLHSTGIPAVPGVFVQIGNEKCQGDQGDDGEPCITGHRVGRVPLHGVSEADHEQGANPEHDSQAFIDGDGCRDSFGEGVVSRSSSAEELVDAREDCAPNHQVDEEDVKEEGRDDPSLQ